MSPEFLLVSVDPFDARRGYRRWACRWVGVRSEVTGAVYRADLWTDRRGALVTRFTCPGRRTHHEVRAAAGGVIGPGARERLEEFLFLMLLDWAAGPFPEDER